MTDSCGNPKDTGQQLMAANIGYDNTLTALDAAHVQTAIDILATGTGLNQHPNMEGRDLDDQHPQSAITGLVDALAGKAETNHRQPATSIDYDNSVVNILGSGTSQAAIDELATIQQVGVIEYGASAIEVVPGEGIAASVNQMDWTGHPHADTVVTTALAIHANHIVTFGNGTNNIWGWFGDKPQLVGLGSGYVATEADFQITGTADHNVLINRELVDAHPQSAITDLEDDLALKLEDAASDGTEYLRKDGAWVNPSAVQHVITGFKNVLINPQELVNQRGFDGNWSVALNYGFDRWYKFDSTHKAQLIEDSALLSGETYTLSWVGDGQGTITAGDGSTTQGISPLTMVGMTLGTPNTTRVTVPHIATKVQLERGPAETDFEVRSIQQELAMCQRYYYEYNDSVSNSAWRYSNAGVKVWMQGMFPVQMRTTPAATRLTDAAYVNCTGITGYASNQSFQLRVTVTALDNYYARGSKFKFDAELT